MISPSLAIPSCHFFINGHTSCRFISYFSLPPVSYCETLISIHPSTMKLKSILVSALCVAALSGYGQTEKGTFLLGGSLTFSHSDNTTTFASGGTTFPTDSKQVNIRLSPSL